MLTVDAGRSAAGRRGAASHTAAAATPTVTREALFRQAGITATRSIAELVETAALLHAQPLPAARGAVAVVSNAGGIGILAADACAEAGLALPEFPAASVAELHDLLPDGAATSNPVDTKAAIGPDQLAQCITMLTKCQDVDALLVAVVPTALSTNAALDPLRALLDGPGRRRIPVVAVLPDQELPVRYLTCADGELLPAYADPAAAARALAHARDRARWLAEPASAVAMPETADTVTAQHLAAAFLGNHPGGGWLDPKATADLLACYDLPLTTSLWVRGEHDVLLAARTLGQLGHDGKVVIKAYWPEQVHKTAAGAIRTELAGADEVRAAYREFEERFGESMGGVVVQPMAAPGLELLAGVIQDQVFGPLVMLGLGGTATDLLDDRSARLAPLTERDLTTMITDLRSAPLLLGRPGTPPIDLASLRQVLAGLSRLANDLPQLAELDLNPLIARSDGLLCVDARVRLEPRPAFDPYLRRLRRPAATQE